MIQPLSKSHDARRSKLKAGKRAEKLVQKAEKQQTAKVERGKVGARLRMMILERDNGKCVLCGRKPTKTNGLELHAHHIIAVAQGGKTSEENLCTLCADCNLGAGARTLDMLRAIGHAIKPAPAPARAT